MMPPAVLGPDLKRIDRLPPVLGPYDEGGGPKRTKLCIVILESTEPNIGQ